MKNFAKIYDSALFAVRVRVANPDTMIWGLQNRMGIQLRWYDDAQSMIYWRFEDGWAVEDLQAALADNRQMLNTVQHRVDLIMDVSQGGLIPPDVIRFLRYHPIETHPLSHMKIVIGTNEYLRLFWPNVAPLTPRRWRLLFAGSLEEALTMIEQDRSPVPVTS